MIVSEPENFPTDLYMMEGLVALLGDRHALRVVPAEGSARRLDADTAVLALTHVNYRSGAMHDMAALTRLAHERGAFAVWDLSHSAGAMPLDVTAAGVDFAVGCGYKYLNGGPGAPAFVYVAERHHGAFRQPLSGWLGHAEPFAFEGAYRPAAGVARMPRRHAADPVARRARSRRGSAAADATWRPCGRSPCALTDMFIAAGRTALRGAWARLAESARAPRARGSQVSFRHPQGYPVMQALIARGVIGDFRAPDILRFGWRRSTALRRPVGCRHGARRGVSTRRPGTIRSSTGGAR